MTTVPSAVNKAQIIKKYAGSKLPTFAFRSLALPLVTGIGRLTFADADLDGFFEVVL